LRRPFYRFLPEVALADVAFAARGDSPEMLFEASAMALTDVMVDRRGLRPTVERQVKLRSVDIDRLLYDFLTELIVLKDVDSLLFKRFEPHISPDGRSLACEMKGEPIDRERHRLRNDVKAVTMHMFGVKHEAGLWKATVVLDI
jgi:SHS2 domain-containing protein